ncbi:MAG: APC family permease [Thermoplasmata archaeon]
MDRTVNIGGAIMQSFTSIGPMLNFVALFSVIIVFSGVDLPIVVLISFLISYATIYTSYKFSKKYSTNGGYFSYVGKALGKRPGLFVTLFYILYGLLILPDIAIFVANFSATALSMSGYNVYFWRPLIMVIFIAIVVLLVSKGIKISIRYILIGGILELLFIFAISMMFIFYRPVIPPLFNAFNISGFWNGTVYGILIFAGSGSAIFISEDTVESKKNIPRSLIISYTLSGLVMVIASFSMIIFLGANNISAYSSNPYIIVTYIYQRFGIGIFSLFLFFTLLSSLNMAVSYLNAFSSAYMKIKDENIIPLFNNPILNNKSKFLALIWVFSVISSMLASYLLGYFYGFVILATMVSLSYIIVHVFTNLSLFYIKTEFYNGLLYILPVLSTIFLSISFYYSFNDFSEPMVYSDYILILWAVISLSGVTLLRKYRADYYQKLEF